MKVRYICGLLAALLLLSSSTAFSGPILKPRKYHGPIPRASLTLRVGFLAGGTCEELWNSVDATVLFGEVNTSDFGNAFTLEGTYTYKLHPQFGIRGNTTLSLFRSDSHGDLIPQIPDWPDTIPLPVYDYTRKFNVELFTIEASGIYYFNDSGVNEFQPYFGAGFTAGIPRATFSEQYVEEGEVIKDTKDTEWSLEAGVHGFLGALYYVKSNLAFTAEAKYQIVQSKYPFLLSTDEGPQNVRFDIDYTGFLMSFGVVWAF